MLSLRVCAAGGAPLIDQAARKVPAMDAWRSGDVTANGVRLHYTRTGDGSKPPLVLAHGVTDDGLCWAPLAAALAPDYDVIMMDARGHGRSDAPESGYGPAEQGTDLAGAIAALGLRQPIVLGHSMGAITTLTLAALYPDLPRAILLEDPPPWWVPDASPAAASSERQAQMRAWVAGLKRQSREELIAGQRALTPHWPEDELGAWADSKLRVSDNVLTIFDPANPRQVDWASLLPRITCPALLITADPARGAILTSDAAAALQALVPHLRVAHVPGAGHSIRRDQFERFLAAVRGFLVELQA
jgi:N-formylmaleamate deformylase